MAVRLIVPIALLMVSGSMSLPAVLNHAPGADLSMVFPQDDARPMPVLMMSGTAPSDGSARSAMSEFVEKATLKAKKVVDALASSTTTFTQSQSTNNSPSKSLRSSLGCFACKMIVKAAHVMIRAGASEDELVSWGMAICMKFKLASPRECHGLIESMKTEVVYVLSQKPIDPGSACSSILDEDCGESYEEKWTVDLPNVPKPMVSPVPSPQVGAATLRILHLADVHFDPKYVAGSNAYCGESLCCHQENGRGSAGPFGNFGACDTPLATLDSLLAHASRTQKVDYVLWTGDDSPHDVWNQTIESHLSILNTTSQLLQKYFPTTPIFAAVGNHEGNPVNSFPTPYAASVATMDWLYGPLNRTWSRWLPATAQQTMTSQTILKGGFYSTLAYPGLRIISVNMNYCNNLNWWLFLNTTDPLGQLRWLADELQAAEDRGEKVQIVGHIPPGSYDCLSTWSANFYRIVNRYESTIRGQFFGHTHMDDFEVFYDLSNATLGVKLRPTNVAYMAPSVTAYNAANPAYRIYTVDGTHPNTTWAVLDHETYFVNLTESNLNGKLKWYLLYKAKDAYRMESLQPSEWNQLIDRMQTDDWLFGLFYRHYHRASDAFPKCVTDDCRRSLLCNARTARSGDHELCQRASGA